MLHRHARRTAVLLLAACWLAGGPGAAPLRAAAECRHERHVHFQPHRHGTPAPTGTPCFCGEMAPNEDLTLPPVLGDLNLPVPSVAVRVAGVPFPRPPSLIPGFPPAPEPPPPNPTV